MHESPSRTRGLAAWLGSLSLLASGASAQTVSFSQLDFDLDGNVTLDSPWGAAELTFTGSSSILYFNLRANGAWRIQNMPVLSTQGSGASQTQRFWFDLGSSPGADVADIVQAFTLTTSPLGGPPAGATLASVAGDAVRIGNGTFHPGFPAAPDPPTGPAVGGLVSDPKQHKNENFPNQESEWGACVPVAVSNSLQFLNAQHELGIDDADITIEKMKTATNFGFKRTASAFGPGVHRIYDPYPAEWPDPLDANGTWWDHDPDAVDGEKNAWWEEKIAYMEDNDLPITTRQVPKTDIAKLIDEIDDHQDIEMVVNGHTAAVTGIADLGAGKYTFTVAHDAEQGVPGGTKEEVGTWDDSAQKFDGALAIWELDYFIVECPELDADAMKTVPGDAEGAGTRATFGSTDLPALPADFFDPGSQPFTGEVALRAAPTPSTPAEWRRFGQPVAPSAAISTQRAVDVEVLALDLVSVAPLVVSMGEPTTELWNVRLSLALAPTYATPPLGTLDAVKTHANGGSFDVGLFVQPVFLFTRVAAPFDTRVLDTTGVLPPLHLSAAGMPWVHQVEPTLGAIAPSQGQFVPGVLEVVPGDPGSQQLVEMPLVSDFGGLIHVVGVADVAAIPVSAPAGRMLLVLLLLGGGTAVGRRLASTRTRRST